jgi:hypothetical protein
MIDFVTNFSSDLHNSTLAVLPFNCPPLHPLPAHIHTVCYQFRNQCDPFKPQVKSYHSIVHPPMAPMLYRALKGSTEFGTLVPLWPHPPLSLYSWFSSNAGLSNSHTPETLCHRAFAHVAPSAQNTLTQISSWLTLSFSSTASNRILARCYQTVLFKITPPYSSYLLK